MAKFVKGQSGCPTGRGKGTLNKRTELSKLLDPHAEALIARLISLATSGDMAAMKLIIERILPVSKIRQEPTGIELPSIMNEKNMAKLKNDILLAVINGKMTADEGDKIIKMIDANYGKPAPTATINFSGLSATEAARVYQQLMRD